MTKSARAAPSQLDASCRERTAEKTLAEGHSPERERERERDSAESASVTLPPSGTLLL